MIKDDLLATAGLAHLALGDAELAAALPAFERMLGYFAAMRAADADGDLLGLSVTDASGDRRAVSLGAFRPDNHPNNTNTNNPPNSVLSEALLDSAPERDGRFILIPNVL